MLGYLTLVWQLVLEKENSAFKPVKLHFKIDLMTHPAHTERLVNYIYTNIMSILVIYKYTDIGCMCTQLLCVCVVGME